MASSSDEPPPSTGSSIRSLSNGDVVRRLLAVAWEFRWKCLGVLVLQVSLLALGLASLKLTGLGIDLVHHTADPGARAPLWPLGFQPPPDWSPFFTVVIIAACVLVLALGRARLDFRFRMALADVVQNGLVVKLRAAVYEKMQCLSFRFFDEHASSSIINRVTGDVQRLRAFIDNVLMQGIIVVLSLAVYLAYMVSLSPALTGLCLATTPIMLLLSMRFTRQMKFAYIQNRELQDQLVLNLSESFQGAHVLKSFGLEDDARKRFEEISGKVQSQQQSIFWRLSLFSPTMGFLTQVNLIILLAYGGKLVIDGSLPLGGGLVVFASLLQLFSSQVTALAGLANTAQESLVGARRVFEILEAPIEIRSDAGAQPLPRARGELRFENVSFAYKPGVPALRQVSFNVAPGQFVALLGPPGSGKSTILSLIPRFYDPEAGRVLLDGRDLRELKLDDLRRNIGMVFQENFLFSTTVAKNIAFGHTGATREQIERAAKIAAAHDFIMSLPKGYDTVLGEHGVGLSGGQRQRLAIARAILLDPRILILDDPLAAVDAETEHEILEALDRAVEGRTVVVSTHRLSTIARANVILVLRDGSIVDKGTHQDLRLRPGYYKAIADLQLVDDDDLPLLEGAAAS